VPCVNIDFSYDQFEKGEANEFPESFVDSRRDFRISQLASMIANSCGAFATLLLFLSFFRRFPPRCFRLLISMMLLVAFAFDITTFRLFAIYWCGGEGEVLDEVTGEYREVFGRCFMEDGAMRMACGAALYLIAAIFVCAMEPPGTAMIEFSRNYEEVPSADGGGETGELEMASTPADTGEIDVFEDEEYKEKQLGEPIAAIVTSVGTGQAPADDAEFIS